MVLTVVANGVCVFMGERSACSKRITAFVGSGTLKKCQVIRNKKWILKKHIANTVRPINN